MRFIKAIARQVVGLFTDDLTLTLAIILWIATAATALPRLPVNPVWDAPILFAGCCVIFMENVYRSAFRRNQSPPAADT